MAHAFHIAFFPEYYSISAADMFVLVHSNFGDHSYNYYNYYYNYRVLSARPHVEASLRDGLMKEKELNGWA